MLWSSRGVRTHWEREAFGYPTGQARGPGRTKRSRFVVFIGCRGQPFVDGPLISYFVSAILRRLASRPLTPESVGRRTCEIVASVWTLTTLMSVDFQHRHVLSDRWETALRVYGLIHP